MSTASIPIADPEVVRPEPASPVLVRIVREAERETAPAAPPRERTGDEPSADRVSFRHD